MTFDELKALDHAHTLQTYGRFDVDVDHGQGATLWDLAGRTYIDFTSGIGVCSVGYGNEKWARAIYDQALTLGHISNLFYSQPYARLAGALCARSGMAAAFFGNSGAEANEGLLKLARKYSHDKYGAGRGTILTLRNSFHGRTLATLAATGQDVFHQHFSPSRRASATPAPTIWPTWRPRPGRTCAPCCWSWSRARAACSLWTGDFVRALAGLCEQRDWLLLGGRGADRHRPHRHPLRLPAVRHPARCRLLCQGHRRRPAHGRLPCEREVPAGAGPRQPRLHLWGATPSAPQPPWRCWTFWTRRP